MPATLRRLLRDPRLAARRLLRRHRRPVAAVLAGAGTLVALTVMRGGPPPAPGAVVEVANHPGIRAGEVAVPVILASGALVAALDVGDVVDLIGLTGTDTAHVVAPRARVIELPTGGTSLTSSSTVVLVAVAEADALPTSSASAVGTMTVVIRGS